VLDVVDLNSDQIRALDRAHTAIILQGGILEEHGPYLPSFSDGYQSEFLATKIADAITARPGWTVLRFPPIPLGAMPANDIGGKYTYPGSYPVRMATLRAVFMDLATDLGDAGFKWVLVMHYHGGPSHNSALDEASRFFADTYGGQMVNVMGLLSTAGAAPHDLFTAAQREAEGFSVHADADEHSRMVFLKPELVAAGVHTAPAVVAHQPSDLVALARKADWSGYFGMPTIATREAGRRKMDGLAAAATDVALRMLDGTLSPTAARVVDQAAAEPTLKGVWDASLEHDRLLEKKEADWLAHANR
jgi:creatinine amidohydrolase/Fe(II)-dependent formamide hydrolase-like protein